MQRSAFCRSRRELSNAYLLAEFRFDTAETEPSKVYAVLLHGAFFASSLRAGLGRLEDVARPRGVALHEEVLRPRLHGLRSSCAPLLFELRGH